jgi:hypothetical protein
VRHARSSKESHPKGAWNFVADTCTDPQGASATVLSHSGAWWQSAVVWGMGLRPHAAHRRREGARTGIYRRASVPWRPRHAIRADRG